MYDPKDDEVVETKDQMSKEEVERYGRSVESPIDQISDMDKLGNLIK